MSGWCPSVRLRAYRLVAPYPLSCKPRICPHVMLQSTRVSAGFSGHGCSAWSVAQPARCLNHSDRPHLLPEFPRGLHSTGSLGLWTPHSAMKGESGRLLFTERVFVVWQEKHVAPLQRRNSCSLPCVLSVPDVVNRWGLLIVPSGPLRLYKGSAS